jgi:Family of unknown function (DUF6069)
MSAYERSQPRPDGRVVIKAGPLWAGGAATACVAALVAAVGVLFFHKVLDIKLVEPLIVLPVGPIALGYAITAFLLGLAATGLAHLLSLTTPRPRVFFGWIIGLVTAAGMMAPFAFSGDLSGKIATAVINLFIGLAIGTLLVSVLSRTVFDAESTWQRH